MIEMPVSLSAGCATSLDDGLALLIRLVETPSLSGQEGPAARVLVDWMACHGLEARVDEAGNAVGVLDGGPAAADGLVQEIVLLGHIDTVNGLVPVALRDGALYGRGSVDAKGPLAAFATAVAQAGPQPGWRIVVIGAVEEEAATSKGARHIVGLHQPALAVIGEPSGWQRITLGYKGRLLVEATVQQAMAHRSGKSASACELAVAFWNRVQAAVDSLNAGKERPWDQVLATLRDFSSHSDGLLDTAHLGLGFRLSPEVSPEQLAALLQDIAGEAVLRFTGPEVAYQANKNTSLVRAFLAAVREQSGQPGFVLKTGTSDMNVVGPAWNCPIVAYGPGDSRLDHTPEEHVELAEWQNGVAVLTRLLRQLPSTA